MNFTLTSSTTIVFFRTGKPFGDPHLMGLHQKGADQSVRAAHRLAEEYEFEHFYVSPAPYVRTSAIIVRELQNITCPEISIRPGLMKSLSGTTAQVMQGLQSVIDEAIRDFKWKTILIVSHGRQADCFMSMKRGKIISHSRKKVRPLQHGEWMVRSITE